MSDVRQRDKCLKVAMKLLTEGTSVAVGKLAGRAFTIHPVLTEIDNTNADRETRAVWVELAQKSKVPIRCVHLTAPTKLCEHNDTVRALAGGTFNPEKRTILPHSAFSSFASRFKQPTVEEGFQDIVPVEFQVGQARTGSSCRLIYSCSSKVAPSSVKFGVSTGSRHRTRP